MDTSKRLTSLASHSAKRLRKQHTERAAGALLSEREQLAQYRQRVAGGHDGLKEITDQHGVGGLQRYLSAMKKLEQKYPK